MEPFLATKGLEGNCAFQQYTVKTAHLKG